MTRPTRRTLAWRLYVLGLLQLVILAVAVVAVGWLIRTPPPDTRGEPPVFSTHADHDRQPRGDRPPPTPPLDDPGAPPGPPPDGRRGPPNGDGHPPAHHHSPVGPLTTFLLSGLVIVGIGSFMTARWIVVPLDRLSRTARAIGEGDLSARTGLTRKDELGEVGRAFDEMAERIQKLLLAEKELMANVSHELRTPLARIRVALDLAGEGDADAGRLSMTEIGTDLAELEALIDDILTATRLAADDKKGPASFAMHTEDLGAEVIAARAAERFRARHPRRPFTLATGDDLPMVRVDPVLFRRVLDNLLENADKYSPDAARPITLRAANDGAGVTYTIEDGGLGIPEGDLPHVFTPFFRGERSRNRGTGGVGLGLTLARRIVEAHGGAIAIESAVGRGTTVRVSIPRAPAVDG